MNNNKVFLGIEIKKKPRKIVTELVDYMLKINRPQSIDELTEKLSETNTLHNLRSRVKRCLTNTPDVVNNNTSEQSRKFSIPLQYKNIQVEQNEDKFLLKLTYGDDPIVRKTDYTEQDLKHYMEEQKKTFVVVKKEFASWLLKNAPTSYNQYMGNNTSTIMERLNEINNFFPERDLFVIENNNVKALINFILFKTNKKERIKNPEFIKYDNFHSNGIPKAVIGKNNYQRFLQEKFNSVINSSKKSLYNWVPTHKELVKFITTKENDQIELIDLLKSVGITPFNDQDVNGEMIPLVEIDPFTFFCYIYKYGSSRRLTNLQEIAKKLNLNYPSDDSGIPSANAQKVWLFPYKRQRVNNEIERLWKFYSSALNNLITDEQFSDILNINGVGITKITEGLFYIMPDSYFPINGPVKPYLKEVFGINPAFNSFSEYKNILQQIRSQSDKPFYQISHEAWLWNDEKIKTTKNTDISLPIKHERMKTNLNTILFGPPGTGKTYNTINESLKIVDKEYYEANIDDRIALNKRFNELLIKDFKNTNGQIAFCTFHQSFSYEDFVEGIKPKTNDKKEVFYEIEPGIFKNICLLADASISASKFQKENKLSWDKDKFKQASFYKLSLGEANNPDDRVIYEYCRDNDVIAIGFGDDTDFSGMSESKINEKCEDLKLSHGATQRLNYFIHYLKKGNYVLVSNGNKYIRCLGKITGDYEFVEDSAIAYHQFRKVEWLFVDENIPIEELYNKSLSQKTIYKLDENNLKQDFFVNKGQSKVTEIKNEKDYVLIIDEINRGNVSSIFGELITLIEADKRAGRKEKLEVILPYSKDPFKVPHNIYLIGTMNTADRSIEALDTALRRRFSFKEMPPKSNLLTTEEDSKLYKTNGKIEDIDVVKILDTINDRIEKLIDKDHKIGHSYFMGILIKEDLKRVFKDKVIPLLEEYFFGDFGKIGLVLGSSFITKSGKENVEFAEFEEYDSSIRNDLMERAVFEITPSDKWDFKSIYNGISKL